MNKKFAKGGNTHGLGSELLRSQAKAIGTPIIQRKTRWIGYEQQLKITINKDFIEELCHLKDKFCLYLCGEYHTFVVNGPMFKDAIDILNADEELQQGQRFSKISSHRMRKKK